MLLISVLVMSVLMYVHLTHRPVDCYTHEPLVSTPGFVNATIYNEQVETGWNFGPYFVHSADFWRQGECSKVGSLSVPAASNVMLDVA